MLNVVTPDNLNPAHFDFGVLVPNKVSVKFPFTPAGGETNTASSVGAGQSLVQGKVGADLRFRSLVAGAGVTITNNGDTLTIASTVVGGSADGNIANVQLSGSDLVFSGVNGGFSGSVSLAPLAGGAADGTVTAATLSGANILSLARSVGAPVTVDLSSLAGGGGSDGVVTGAALSGANILSLTRSVGAPVTVDLSSLAGVVSVTANAPLFNTGTAAAPVLDVDFAALAPADATALATALCANTAFRECVMDIFLEGFSQAGGELQIADGTNGSGVFTFTPCP